MQFTNDELILAAHIRSLAGELRDKAAVHHAAKHHGGATTGRDEFKQIHPISEFYEAAMNELKDITGTVIRR